MYENGTKITYNGMCYKVEIVTIKLQLAALVWFTTQMRLCLVRQGCD